MGVDKVILRAFLSTLAAIATLLLLMILSLCAIFPSTMMELTYSFGMESLSIRFAERAYKDSDDVYYIAYATEVAIEQDSNAKILSCGERFIGHEGFDSFCEKKGEGYRQFIYGKVCVSKYEVGDKSAAIELAYESLQGSFPKNNALVAVLIAGIEAQDGATISAVDEKLSSLQVSGEEQAYLQEIRTYLIG